MTDQTSQAIRVETLPGSDQPVLVLDAAHPAPAQLIEAAAGGPGFKAIAPHYPGVRAPVPRGYLDTVMPALGPHLRDVFGLKTGVRLQECYFSLSTTPAERLKPMQRLPHIDGVDPDKVAVLHYLCGASHGGTSFYRHRATGLQTIHDPQFQPYRSAVYADVERLGQPGPAYPAGSDEMYERIAFYEAVFNQIIVYRGCNLHALSLGPSADSLSPDPRRGRLTVNTFLGPPA